jgi:hypothetical protein
MKRRSLTTMCVLGVVLGTLTVPAAAKTRPAKSPVDNELMTDQLSHKTSDAH